MSCCVTATCVPRVPGAVWLLKSPAYMLPMRGVPAIPGSLSSMILICTHSLIPLLPFCWIWCSTPKTTALLFSGPLLTICVKSPDQICQSIQHKWSRPPWDFQASTCFYYSPCPLILNLFFRFLSISLTGMPPSKAQCFDLTWFLSASTRQVILSNL